MGELGHKRSAKKCKEKFENVYKYHKRTKEGRSGKSEGKTYRFFYQLEAFENPHSFQSHSKSPEPTKLLPLSSTSTIATTTTAAVTPLLPWFNSNNPSSMAADSSPLKHHVSVAPTTTNPTLFPKQSFALPFVINSNTFTTDNLKGNVSSLNLFSSSTSSSTASDKEHGGRRLKKKKKRRRRYWKGLFKELTEELMEKQEEMQKRFLDALEKHESERIARGEAWRAQETSRINREHEILVHERSMAAAKDAAFISFLEKFSRQQPHKQQQPQQFKSSEQKQQQQQQHWNGDTIWFQSNQNQERSIVETTTKASSNYLVAPSSSRWPNAEVEALIRLRTNLDSNYQENATKGPLWEEISTGMRRLGYYRSAKRCKEKWENINKYFKKVKESNKKRSEDSKTCPYFHQLDAIYKERNKISETTLPLMVAPEHQLPVPQETSQNQITEKHKVENEGDQVRDDEVYSEEDHQEDEEEGQEERKFEMVHDINKTCASSMDINNTIIA